MSYQHFNVLMLNISAIIVTIFRAIMTTDYPGYVFGAVVAAGGAMGYVKKRSVPSLVAGLAFGGLAMAGAYHVND